jgi:hypothetical protein
MANHLPNFTHSKFNCTTCSFISSNKKDYNRHMMTAKHMRLINTNDNSQNLPLNAHTCICGKEYKHAPSLSKHKKTCTYTPPSSTECPENTITYTIEPVEPATNEVLILKTMIFDLIKQNTLLQQNQLEMQTTLKEMIPHLGNNTTNNTNSHNTFNVQFFLENDCRNAQSIQEFVKSIEFNQEHLVSMTKDGYVDTISNILIEALNKMAVTDRPLHCTDLKRETVYIKDKESWNKSTADAPLMNRVISSIEHGCVIEVKKYVDETPQSKELDTPEYNFYHKAHWNTLGAGEDASKLNKKIYKKVLPEVKLEKQPV